MTAGRRSAGGRLLDHIVLAAPDLQAAVRQLARLTGVDPVAGGRHLGLGTENYLLGLGDGAYLEMVGPDREQPEPPHPRPFGVDALNEPRLVTWAIRPADLDRTRASAQAAGHHLAPPVAMSRRTTAGETLRWRLTYDPHATGDGVVPFLIDWGATTHPAESGLPVTSLTSFWATHPAPAPVRGALAVLGADLAVHAGPRPGLVAVLAGRSGPVTLR